MNFKRILTELWREKFEWFDPSPIEPFNLDKNRVGHDLLGQRAAEPVENLGHLPVLLVEQAAGLALLRDELHEQRVRHLSWKVRYRTLLWFFIQMIKLYKANATSMKWLFVVFFGFQEFWPNSDLNSSNGSVPRLSNLSTKVTTIGETGVEST